MAAGQVTEAIALFRKSMAGPLCRRCAAPQLANALEAAGQRDSAIAQYELVLGGSDLGEIDMPLHQVRARYRLGELYAERGDRERAKEHLGRFIELWRDADPVLQPRVAEARRRLAELTAEGR
ncbi:MAG: tetratricopeptide repeat protein [Gemmatimonadales bacterium]